MIRPARYPKPAPPDLQAFPLHVFDCQLDPKGRLICKIEAKALLLRDRVMKDWIDQVLFLSIWE